MSDDSFDRAIQSLLDGDRLASGVDSSGSAHLDDDPLRVVDAIARVHRLMLFGTEVVDARVGPRTWGHLEVRAEIGRGASGTVYRAWDTRLAREVALKLFTAEAPPADAIDEGRLLARLNHPHIVRVFGADTHDSVSGIWMELLEGDTLDDILARDGPFSPEEALLTGLDLARALSAVHEAGLLHRDVKARNVLRERGGRVVLMDLGAGRLLDQTPAFDAEGTPMYMAPEVLAGGPATVRSDIYCLGVLLYRLLTRNYPVSGAQLDDLRAAHAAGLRSELSLACPDAHPEAVSAIERCCHPRAEGRPGSAAEVENLVHAALQNTLDASGGLRSPAARWVARWTPVALTTVIVLVVVSLGVWAAWNTTTGRTTRRLVGLPVGPMSPLFMTVNGGIAIVDGGRLSLVPYNPGTATVLAVSSDLGVQTMTGVPPWTPGAGFTLDGTPAPPISSTSAGLCCFYDGTTDGRFNYAVRADTTLLAPIGSRPLAPPAVYRFERDWSNPQTLFPVSTSGWYSGIAYSAGSDTFWMVRHESGDSIVEEWSRDGTRRPASLTLAGAYLSGIAVDPRDGTLWAANLQSAAPTIRLENIAAGGRRLGTFDVERPLANFLSIDAAGVEFAWMPSQ
ncbi:MAG: serine/threonine-protein kinase [Vicinamibacterales bacterium]